MRSRFLADELTLVRGDMDQLQRTSLNKDEAKALNDIVAKAAEFMAQTTKAAPGEIQAVLKADRDQMAHIATQAATEAAKRVMTGMTHAVTKECARLSEGTRKAIASKWSLGRSVSAHAGRGGRRRGVSRGAGGCP